MLHETCEFQLKKDYLHPTGQVSFYKDSEVKAFLLTLISSGGILKKETAALCGTVLLFFLY